MDTYSMFMDRLEKLKKQLHQTLADIKSKKLKIAAYGASAKGTTLLNYFKIGSEYLDLRVL